MDKNNETSVKLDIDENQIGIIHFLFILFLFSLQTISERHLFYYYTKIKPSACKN